MDAVEDRTKKARARVGSVLKEKWHLDKLLGVGGMAAVYEATHTNNGKHVAVKMLHPELSIIPQIKTRFLREGYASNKVKHPGVVSVLDDDSADDGSVFLVMELLEGENLEQRRLASGGKLDLLEVLWIGDQLLDVLAAAHAVEVIHRDIKPENVFLTKQAVLKVLDFGLARVNRPKQERGLTRTNMLMGTLDFMAPEQARGKWEGVGGQADIWSVGATLFMLLTGHPVHEEDSVEAQLKAVTTRPARSIGDLRPDLPRPVISLIDRALAFTPAQRWLTAVSMQEAVRDVYMRVGGGENRPSVRAPSMTETPTTPAKAEESSSWDSDLASTHAISHLSLEEDVTRDLSHLPTHALPPAAPTAVSAKTKSAEPEPLTVPVPPVAPVAAPAPAQPPTPLSVGPLAASADAPTNDPTSFLERHRRLIILGSLPVWLLLFWGAASLRACGRSEAVEPPTVDSATPPASTSAIPAVASSSPFEITSATPPPPSASSSTRKKPPTTRPIPRPRHK